MSCGKMSPSLVATSAKKEQLVMENSVVKDGIGDRDFRIDKFDDFSLTGVAIVGFSFQGIHKRRLLPYPSPISRST